MHVLQSPERPWGYRFCACCLWQFASSATAYTSIWGWTEDNKGSFLSLCDFRSFFQQFWKTSTNLLVEHSLQAFHLYLNNLEKERERDTRTNPTKVARDCNVGGVRMASISILPMSKLSMLRASFSQPLPFLWLMLHANFCHCSKATKTTFQT